LETKSTTPGWITVLGKRLPYAFRSINWDLPPA
jgi:hypothetical protein